MTESTTLILKAPHDPVTGEIYWNGRWWQPDERREMITAMERYEDEREANND